MGHRRPSKATFLRPYDAVVKGFPSGGLRHIAQAALFQPLAVRRTCSESGREGRKSGLGQTARRKPQTGLAARREFARPKCTRGRASCAHRRTLSRLQGGKASGRGLSRQQAIRQRRRQAPRRSLSFPRLFTACPQGATARPTEAADRPLDFAPLSIA